MTARTASRSCCRRAFPICSPTAPAGIAVGMATSIPPHNVGELCDALVHLVQAHPRCHRRPSWSSCVPGPDFPTGGVLVEAARRDRARPTRPAAAASACARAGRRRRSRHGLYQIVVTEIPYQVQKSRLIERIAELLEERKLPLLADVRDESTEQVRLVLEPKTRNVDPGRADGIAVPRDRAGDARAAQPERARRRRACRG